MESDFDPAAEISADQFFDTVFLDIPPGWRRGQTAFNGLLQVRPDLAETIRSGPLDPFNDDDTLPAFEEWVRRNW